MEININVDFAGTYLSYEQSSTCRTTNVTTTQYPVGRCDSDGSDEYETFYGNAQFATGLIIYPVLCVTGIIGNSLSLVVLSHKDMATSTNIYLLVIVALTDSFFHRDGFMWTLVICGRSVYSEYVITVVVILVSFSLQVAVCVTAWLTVSVAMDRYISVCYPSVSKTLCTIPKARTVVTSVFVIMILLSIPSGFRYRLQTIHDTINNITCMELVVTELGRNKEFMIPYTWVQNFLRGIIPVFILVFLNARIINVLRKERVKGKKFSARNRITIMLITMVVVFIVCITPDAIMSTFFGKGYVEEDSLVKGIREITDSLVALNSAINFLLYCTLSVAFRNTFMKVFFGRNYVKMRGANCTQQGRDRTTPAIKNDQNVPLSQPRADSDGTNSNRSNLLDDSPSKPSLCDNDDDLSCQSSPGSDVIRNGYSQISEGSFLMKTLHKGHQMNSDCLLTKEKIVFDARLNCSVYTGPLEAVQPPWERQAPKVTTVCMFQGSQPDSVQL
ncbi:unnamed protein product [Candidula unifasciata]|uniref:G-protein coupled receptors family 1 profile domain-containing protein n=1 Tax=Candidula unifasciata TaxID=100452 RepID=A0A8S3YDM2_9EUPU|nr:unnamed protein product [Candidula unifasciata]